MNNPNAAESTWSMPETIQTDATNEIHIQVHANEEMATADFAGIKRSNREVKEEKQNNKR